MVMVASQVTYHSFDYMLLIAQFNELIQMRSETVYSLHLG